MPPKAQIQLAWKIKSCMAGRCITSRRAASKATLYNEDGTECKPAPKPASAKVKKIEPKKPEQRQPSLFDLLEPQQPEPEAKDDEYDGEDDQPSQEEIDEILAELAEEEAKAEVKPQKPVSPIWQRYQDLQKKYPDCIIYTVWATSTRCSGTMP